MRKFFFKIPTIAFLPALIATTSISVATASNFNCSSVFSSASASTYKSVLRLILSFEQTRSKHSGLGIDILASVEDHISRLSFDDLFNLFRPESGLRPFFIHDPHMRKAIGHGLYRHSGDRTSRAEFIRKLLYEEIDFEFYDELLGVDRFTLEESEKFAIDKAITNEERQRLHNLGLGYKHDNWFSNPHELMATLASARKLGVKSVVDLGSGAGRLGLLLGVLYTDMTFIGLDIYEPRTRAAQMAADRWGFSDRIKFKSQDLLDLSHPIPEADFYYMFGPTKNAEINSKILDRIKLLGESHPIFIQSRQETTLTLLLTSNWLHRIVSRNISDEQIFTNRPWLDWYSILHPSRNSK